jgi:TetR/AcrR family transcriptional regulator, ethionamide resistance regulator
VAITKKGADERAPRRRRAPDEARREILDAAASLIAERPIREVTVLAIMQRTTLSRKSFYVYFQDRSEVISALIGTLRKDTDAALATWREAADPVAAGKAALRSAAMTYREHGPVLRAVFWSSAEEPDLAAVRRDLTLPVVEIAERTIARAIPAIAPEAARAMAEVLVTMNVHSLLGLQADTSDADVDALVDTISTIWERTIFPHD